MNTQEQTTRRNKLLLALVFAAGISLGTSGPVYAQKFNSLIANPFVFCSAPKPCRLCQPWRRIYQEICADQKNANTAMSREPAVVATPIMVTVDQDGRKSYSRTVDGWTIRSFNRVDIEDASLNSDMPAEGVQVIDGPVAEAQLRSAM